MLSGSNDALGAQLPRNAFMTYPSKHRKEGVILLDSLLFFTWLELIFSFIRAVDLSSTGVQVGMIETLISSSCSKEAIVKKRAKNGLMRIERTVLLTLAITEGNTDKIICPEGKSCYLH